MADVCQAFAGCLCRNGANVIQSKLASSWVMLAYRTAHILQITGHVVPNLEGEQLSKLQAFLESQRTDSGL